VKIRLLGVRGSTPAPGPEFVRYGGHTSCVAVYPDGSRDPVLLLDAGTGIRSVDSLLSRPVFRGSILLSHLHWDHLWGLPFFAAGDHPDSAVQVCLPAQGGLCGQDLLARSMSPPSFPIAPDELRGDWTFVAVEPGVLELEGFVVRCAEIAHKGGRTYGYRISDGSGTIAYLPDHCPNLGVSTETLDLICGVDILLHDAQFLAPERAVADAYGHATVDDAVALATQAGAKTVVLTHHSPTRTDTELDELADAVRAPMAVVVAHQGLVLDLATVGNRTSRVSASRQNTDHSGRSISATGDHPDRREAEEPAMTTNQSQPTATQTGTDDVEGHRIAPFIEDHRDATTGPLQPSDDVQGHLRRPFTDDAEDDVEGHRRVPFTDDAEDDVEGHKRF
jgi:phosphoribosyl 1,2-cyclic phosphodiesterase